MARQCLMLSGLNSGPNWDFIQVRVSRMWDSITKSANEVYSINLQLMDIQGNQKHALVPKSLLDKFSDKFEEQSTYEIERFNVYPSKPDYRVIDENLMIIFRRDTEVKSLSPIVCDIPRYKFGFVNDDILAQRVDKVAQLTDIVGLLTGISEVVPTTTGTGCQIPRREITLTAESGKILGVTLWANKTNLIDMSNAKAENQPTTLIFTAMKGEFTFSSTSATMMYANIDLNELDGLISSASQSGISSITTIDTERPSGNIQTVRTTLASMQSDIRSNDCLGKKFMVPITLMKINTMGGWSYLSCPICRKTLKKEEIGFICPKCNTNVEKPVNRYRLTIEVFDHTSSATEIAFDKEAECLVKHTVDDLIELSKLEYGTDKVDKLLTKLSGAEVQMELRPTNYDIINRGKTLTISRIANIHQPYERLDQKPTNLNKIAISSTILTAESNTAKEICSLTKGKQKMDQFNDKLGNEMKEKTKPSTNKTRARGGIIIGNDAKKAEVSKNCRGKKKDKKMKT